MPADFGTRKHRGTPLPSTALICNQLLQSTFFFDNRKAAPAPPGFTGTGNV